MKVKEVPIAITVAFFVLYFVMGNLVLLNLFIATVLEKLKIIDGATEPTITDAAKVCVPTAGCIIRPVVASVSAAFTVMAVAVNAIHSGCIHRPVVAIVSAAFTVNAATVDCI